MYFHISITSFVLHVADQPLFHMMASGGKRPRLSAVDEDATIETNTSPQEVWSPGSGEMYKARVWEDLRDLFQQDELTDVMLAAEGQSIPCHRVLLAAASKFFHDKFVVNPESLDHNLLDIAGIDFDTLTSVVSYIYSGHIALTVAKTEKLIPASVSLMLPELTKVCKDFLHYNINHDTSACIDVRRIARANSLTDLAEKTWQVMLQKVQEVFKLNSFKNMPETELQEYIRDEGLNIANRDPVFKAVVTWVRHDVENRKSSFENLIENVKLSHCTAPFLGEVVKQEPLMKTAKCMECLAEAMYQHMHDMATQLQQGSTRGGSSEVNTLIAVYEDHYWTLKDGESDWVRQGSSEGRKYGFSSACMTGDGILVTGGFLNRKYVKQCWKITLPMLSWATMPDLNVARSDHATVCVGSKVYVLGGEIGPICTKPLSSIEYLDKQNGSWHVAGDMLCGLYYHTAVSYKTFIYVFGGRTAGGDSLATFMMDTANNKWSRKADMPGGCLWGSSMVYRDRIYVLGSDNDCCMSYDPDQDQWKTHSKPAVTHESTSAVLWKDRILLCGGENTLVIEEYNPDTDTWSEWKHQLPVPGVAAVFAFQM